MKKKNLISPGQMLQFLIHEMEHHNEQLSNDFVHNFFTFEMLDTNAISVSIKKKKYKVVYIERECIFAIFVDDEEICAIESIEDIVLYLLA